MKIIIRDPKDKNLTIRFPSFLVLNAVSAMLLAKIMRKYGANISRQQAKLFIKELNRYRRHHRNWKMVEVQSADGEYVEIKI